MLTGIFSLIREILHSWRESGRNNVQAGDSLLMRESWKPCIRGVKRISFVLRMNQ